MSKSAKLHLAIRSKCIQSSPIVMTVRGMATASNLPKARIPPSALSYHWDTTPPTPLQLAHASKFFSRRPPTFLWSAEKFKTMDFGNSPEVCFLGRSNVGKSSLLNALLCKRIAHTSSKPGRTKLMNAFAVGSMDDADHRLVVLDMPGYGKGGRAEWGTQIIKYLEKRKELKRAFLLVDSEHGIKESDLAILGLFKEKNIPYQVVLSKADKIVLPGNRLPNPAMIEGRLAELRQTMELVKEAIQPDSEDDGGAVGEIIACSSEKWVGGKRMGIDALRFAMLQAAGLEFRPKITLAKPTEIVSYEELFGIDHDK